MKYFPWGLIGTKLTHLNIMKIYGYIKYWPIETSNTVSINTVTTPILLWELHGFPLKHPELCSEFLNNVANEIGVENKQEEGVFREVN